MKIPRFLHTTNTVLLMSILMNRPYSTTAFLDSFPKTSYDQQTSFSVALHAEIQHSGNDDDTNNRMIQEAEDAAAWDGHDSIDAGMETAAEERALMMAEELAHKLKTTSHPPKTTTATTKASYDDQHLAHGFRQVHVETNDEVHDAEDMAAWDGHDSADAGMETAAEERAVMMAAELARTMKANKKNKEQNNRSDTTP